ncbi:MAG: DUF1361 domain-containing protein [bacterium]|nr:DUF1361 domain-containing protein [bacterium]
MDLSAMSEFHHIRFHVFLNIVLAVVPVLLSTYLFRTKQKNNSFIWILLFILFIVFLPNAPYTITDYIHLVATYREFQNKAIVYVIVLPMYLIYWIICLESYVISLLFIQRFLRRKYGLKSFFIVEVILTLYCSIGIFIGRFERINSWNIFTHPLKITEKAVSALFQYRSLRITIEVFIITLAVYYFLKYIDIFIWKKIEKRMMRLNGK